MNVDLVAADDGTYTLTVSKIPPSTFNTAKPPGPITSGQSRAYHAKAGDLARKRGETPAVVKEQALEFASERFGREIGSSTELDELEASWVLDWLDAEFRKDAEA
jgi:hypothetical protein